MKKLVTLILMLVLFTFPFIFGSCGIPKNIIVSNPVGGSMLMPGNPVTITFRVKSEEITTVKIELYAGDAVYSGAEGTIDANFSVTAYNTDLTKAWTVPNVPFATNYKIVISNSDNEEDFGQSGSFQIGLNPSKPTIIFDATVTYGSSADWSFNLYMAQDDGLILPDQDYGGEIGLVDWGFPADNIAILTPDILVSQISAGNNDLPDDDQFQVPAGVYDWGITLTYGGQHYVGQFVTDFTDLNNQYNFQAGETYRIAPQYPQGLEICHNPATAPTAATITPSTAALGANDVSVVITGTNFTGTPTVRLAAKSLDDDKIIAKSVTVDSATQITCVFDIPSSAPYTGQTQSTITVAWYLQIIQDGAYTSPKEFTITQTK